MEGQGAPLRQHENPETRVLKLSYSSLQEGDEKFWRVRRSFGKPVGCGSQIHFRHTVAHEKGAVREVTADFLELVKKKSLSNDK